MTGQGEQPTFVFETDAERVRSVRGWARVEITEVEADPRFHYKPADVHINAPLALEQVALKVRHRCAQQVLRFLGEVVA